MKAISYQGPRKMSVSSHSKPKIKKPTDALLRVTTTGICGSDLHMYDGRTPLDKNNIGFLGATPHHCDFLRGLERRHSNAG